MNSEPEAIGTMQRSGQLPAELLDDLERDGLRALGVVRAHVDVHERPVLVLGRQLGAEAVDVVVVAAHRDEVGAVDAGREDLLLLEVGGDEDVGRQAERGGRRRATALPRLPVDAQASAPKPSSRARAEATATTRSLNEWVGFAASFLTHTSRRPSCSASRSARISGVQPAGRPARDASWFEGPGGPAASGRKSA